MSKAKVVRERIYECEVRRYKVDSAGKRSPFWKTKLVADAVADDDKDYRCKDCHGQVKLYKKNVANGPAPHVEHRVPADSEHCRNGILFQQATDGREHSMSEQPVQ